MRRSFKAIICFVLIAVLLFSVAGCRKKGNNTIILDDNHTHREPEKQPEQSMSPEELTNHWEGVFKNSAGYVIIKDAEDDAFAFTVSVESGTLSGFALINGGTAEYMEESFGLAISVSGDKLMMQQEGENPYGDFSGIFNRTGDDPYTFVIIKETEDLPSDELDEDGEQEGNYNENYDSVSTSATYSDPNGRFTATYPDVFVMGDAEMQPHDGVYMEGIDSLAYLTIQVIEKHCETGEDLVKYLDETYGILASVRPDDLVVYSNRYTDGYNTVWAEFVFIRIMEYGAVQLEYTFAEELYDQLELGCDVITIKT